MRFGIQRLLLSAIAAAVVSAGAASLSAVRAEDFAGDVPDRVWIDVGGAYNDVSTNVSVQGPKGLGGLITFEDTFDLPGTKTTARMLGTVRISEKRRWIDFGYTSIDRRGTKHIVDSVDFGDYIFSGDADVTARFATQFMYAAFRYDFLHEDKIRISGSAGLTFLRLKVSLRTDGTVTDPDGNVITGGYYKQATQGAPVPMVGLNLDWALTKRLVLRSYNRFFRLNLSSFNGGLYENGIHLNYYIVRHFGLGLGLDRTELKVKELKVGEGNVVKAGYTVNGIGLYANLAW
jgi:hypothetical protein